MLALEQPEHAPGWTTVTRLAEPNTPPGLVPSDYIEFAHAELVADFVAEQEGEVSAAAGARVWMLP